MNAFIAKSIEHLKAKDVPIQEIIEFTDNCSSQYKSRFTFNTMTEFDIPYTRHYYGVKHGKGPSDRAGGRFKKFLCDAVKSKHILLKGEQVEAYCRDAYCVQRTCHRKNNELRNEANNEVDLQEKKRKKQRSPEHIQWIVFNHPIINRTPDEKLRGITGSRDYMYVVRNTGATGVVQYRMFDCLCYGCVTHNKECSQQEYADEWITACVKGKLKHKAFNVETWFKGIGKQTEQNDEEFDESEEEITEDCDVAAASDADTVVLLNENDKPLVELSANSYEAHNESCEDEDDNEYCQDEDNNESCIFVSEQEYVSSECSSESEVEYLDEGPEQILDYDDSLSFDWHAILQDMKEYKTFASLKDYVERTSLPSFVPRLKFIMEEEDNMDEVARFFWPRDGPKEYFPIKTGGDGNCLPRAFAHIFLSSENRHKEFRVRITFAAVRKADDFIMSENISRGCPEGTENRAASYANYSGMLPPEVTVLDDRAIRDVYERDVMSNRLDGSYMGIWQFHHAAEAIKRPIGCVYPRRTNQVLRKDMNRIILPLNLSYDNLRPGYVMWTPISDNDHHSEVIHFVALMKKVNVNYS